MSRPSVESETLRVEIEPEHGARIVSIRAVETRREWLVTSSAPDAATYGDSFTDRVIHGWDEMLPTLDACVVDGLPLPDHGEVWAIGWSAVAPLHSGGVRLSTQSRSMPLLLTREAWASGPSIVLDYELTNLGPRELPVQWAAHPQWAVSSKSGIELEYAAGSASPPQPGLWEEALRAAEQLPVGDHQKVWLDSSEAIRAVTITDGTDLLRMSWEGEPVRNLAVLWDNQQFSRERVLAIEPAFNRGENLALASASGDALQIGADETLCWRVTLTASRL